MATTESELRGIDKSLLHILNKKNIKLNKDVAANLGSNFKVEGSLGDIVMVHQHPYNVELKVYNLDYVQKNNGCPIEIEVNEEWGYYKIKIHCTHMYKGYDIKEKSSSGEFTQSRTIKPEGNHPFDFYLVRNGLEELLKVPEPPKEL